MSNKLIVKKPLQNLQEIEQDPKNRIPFASYKKQNPAFQKYLEKTPDGKFAGGSFWDTVKEVASTVGNVAEKAAPYLPLLLGLGYEPAKMKKMRKSKVMKPTDMEEMKVEIEGGKRMKKSCGTMNGGKKNNKMCPPMEGGKKHNKMCPPMEGGKKKRGLSDKMKKRMEKVKQLMAERGISMIDASKAIKSEKIEY
jgi:basic membrane lipoprotein Med (substrate-binding protein (PBP1-ABC) superfamily)